MIKAAMDLGCLDLGCLSDKKSGVGVSDHLECSSFPSKLGKVISLSIPDLMDFVLPTDVSSDIGLSFFLFNRKLGFRNFIPRR